MEIVNGYEVDTLARALYDARKQVGGPATDEEWQRYGERFPVTYGILLDEAREIAMED